jgi:hypothetical protein
MGSHKPRIRPIGRHRAPEYVAEAIARFRTCLSTPPLDGIQHFAITQLLAIYTPQPTQAIRSNPSILTSCAGSPFPHDSTVYLVIDCPPKAFWSQRGQG